MMDRLGRLGLNPRPSINGRYVAGKYQRLSEAYADVYTDPSERLLSSSAVYRSAFHCSADS